MQRLDGTLLHSASDLVGFLDCEHRTVLDRANLDVPAETSRHDEHAKLLQRKGHEHERAYLEQLKTRHRDVAAVESDRAARAAIRRDSIDFRFAAVAVFGLCAPTGSFIVACSRSNGEQNDVLP